MVTGSGNGSVSRMMRGTQGNIGLIPQEVADKLSGRSFNNFNEFRSAFWKEVANSTYAKEFSSGNIGRMQKGLAPRVLDTQQYGGALNQDVVLAAYTTGGSAAINLETYQDEVANYNTVSVVKANITQK